MKKYIKVIICILVVLIILVSILLLTTNKLNEEKNNQMTINTSTTAEENTNAFQPVNNIENYFIVKNIVDRYIEKTKHLNGDSFINEKILRISKEETIEQEKQESIKYFENVLDKEYKNYYNLSQDNYNNEANKYVIQGDYTKSDIIYKVNINGMYECKYNENITLFLVYANVNEKSLNLLVKYNNQKNIYSLFLENYIKDNNYEVNMSFSNIKLSDDEINESMYNKSIIGTITEEDMAKEYFNIQKNNFLYDLKSEYEKLNSKYREQKFRNYNEFEEYYSNLKDEIKNSKLEKYGVEKNDNRKIYTLMDNNDKIYIIECADGLFNYNVVLDNYTVDTPQFLTKYNSASVQEKVVLNIEKVFTAINNKDYRYVYSKLADSFKNNYFKNEEELKKFIEDNFFSKNVVEYEDFNREGTVCTYKIRVIKEFEQGEQIPEGKNAPSAYLNIVMQLKEGTDFEFSFRFIK